MRIQTAESAVIESTLKISDKERGDVDFILNNAQVSLDASIQSMRAKGDAVRIDVPKSRQRGVSAYVLAHYFIAAITERNVSARIVAHESKATEKLLNRVRYYIKHMKGPKPKIHRNNKYEVTFPTTDSSLSIYTAGSEEAARGDTITHLHCSETAFWPNPKKLTASLYDCVPKGGMIINESTGNGSQTWWHKRCLRSLRGEGAYICHFIPWYTSDEYTLDTDRGGTTYMRLRDLPRLSPDTEAYRILSRLRIDFEEDMLLDSFPEITAGQLKWRRFKIDEKDNDLALFKQEYPATFDECFMQSDKSYFHSIHAMVDTNRWKQINKNLYLLEGHPIKGLHYGIGSDVSGGVEKDSSTIQVGCLETNEQVGVYRSNRIAPDVFADEIENVGRIFRFPPVVVEANNHGHVTLDNLTKNGIYPREMIYWDESFSSNITRAGHTLNRKTKPLACGRLSKLLANHFRLYDDVTIGEISTFTDELKASGDCYDDHVLGLVHMNKAFEQAMMQIDFEEMQKEEMKINNPASFESIFRNIGRKTKLHMGQPVSPGVYIPPKANPMKITMPGKYLN